MPCCKIMAKQANSNLAKITNVICTVSRDCFKYHTVSVEAVFQFRI